MPDTQLSKPVCLFDSGSHSVHWIGVHEDTAFRCNSYLVLDGEECVLIDPGGRDTHARVREGVAAVTDPDHVVALTLSHQDPDVGASVVDWLAERPNLEILASPRSHVILPHFGTGPYERVDSEQDDVFVFGQQGCLRCIEAPFLHSPASVTFYDETSRLLFSGDVWGALDVDWKLEVEDFGEHVAALNAFHLDYMASSVAARGFVRRLERVEIGGILPQHGSIIPERHVAAALEYLADIMPGLDIIYPDL